MEKSRNVYNLIHSKYYSIILDSAPDISDQEQITVVFRFVYLNPSTKIVDIIEHFFGFHQITDTTGISLTDFLLGLKIFTI